MAPWRTQTAALAFQSRFSLDDRVCVADIQDMTHTNRLSAALSGVCESGLSAKSFMAKKASGEENEPGGAHAEQQRKKLLTRAYLELKQGNYKMAKSLARFVCDTYADTDAYAILAASAQKLGEHPLSARAYELALAQRPDDMNLNLAYGELCLQAGQVDKARTLLAHCMERDPQARHPAAAKARALFAQCV